MSMNARIIEQFDRLLKEGNKILVDAGWDGKAFPKHYPSAIDYQRFRTEALNIIKRACGEDSDHYLELKRIAETKETTHNSYYFKECYGILEAAKKDYEGGWLFNLKALVAAELLGDFLEQAEVLLEQGYINPAASLAGAVLEDTLRKLCQSKNIPIPDKTKIDRLNAELAKAGVYDTLIQKRITAIADIRNNADHGHFDKYKKEDVEDMVKWIRRFTTDYLH